MTDPGNSFAWLSAPGLSALSVLHVRGRAAGEFFTSRGWRKSGLPRHVWLKAANGEALDEVMIAREDGGFTVTCHGGPAVRAAFETELCAAGFTAVDPYTLPLMGAATRYKREMLRLLAAAQSDQGVRYCLWALEHGEALVAARLDLPANKENAAALRALVVRSANTHYFFEPLRVHLWGPVNAGKSSLLNALCGEHLAAVGDEPGLTRDIIEGRFEHRGYAILVFDTPGEIRGGSELEQRAFREARQQLGEGEVVLHLVPPGAAPPADSAALVVYSRADEAPGRARGNGFPCEVSVRDAASIQHLKDLLVALQAPAVSPEAGDAYALSAELRKDLMRLADGEAAADELRHKWL